MKPLKYRAEWYIPHQVIFMAVWGDSSKEAMNAYLTTLNEMVASTENDPEPRLIHVIADFSKIGKQITVIEMAQVLKHFSPHPKVGWAITYGESHPIRRMITDIGRQLMKLRQRSFDSFDQAVAFLHEIDDTIDWSQANDGVLTQVRPTPHEIEV